MTRDDPILTKIDVLADTHRIAIVQGLYERIGDEIHNIAIAHLPGGRRVVQPKSQIVGYEQDRTAVRSGGEERTIFTHAGLKMAILVCADAGIGGIFEQLSAQGCDLVLLMTAGCGDTSWGFHQAQLADPEVRRRYIERARSVCFVDPEPCLRLNMAMACCNQAGFDEKLGYFHPGHSSVTDRTGNLTALIPGRFVFEHLRPELAVGFVTCRS
jgi:predicted amidohydrolase